MILPCYKCVIDKIMEHIMNTYEKTSSDFIFQKDTMGKIRVWRAEIGYNSEDDGYRAQ